LAGERCNLDWFSKTTENRKLAERPAFNGSFDGLEKFRHAYQAYFNDNFTFRNLLIRGNYLLRADLLGTSTVPHVIIGKQGWLYHTGDLKIGDNQRITTFSEDQLQRWTRALVLKKSYLNSRGIRYLLVIPPNKGTIYPEYMPSGYQKVRTESALDVFYTYLKTHANIDIVDLRVPLNAEKNTHALLLKYLSSQKGSAVDVSEAEIKSQLLYLKTDTHWNKYGAFVGYKAMCGPITAWFPSIKPYDIDDFIITLEKRIAGDLVTYMGGPEPFSEDEYVFTPKRPSQAVVTEIDETKRTLITMMHPDTRLPRVVIFRDSFFNALTSFIMEHFHISRFIWNRWDSQTPMESIIATYKPDLVIEEILERLTKEEPDVFNAGVPAYLTDTIINKAVADGVSEQVDLKNISNLNQVTSALSPKGLVLKSNGSDPQVMLPPSRFIPDNRNGGVIVQIKLESPVQTDAQLFYKTKNSPEYSEGRSIRITVHKGPNTLNFPVTDHQLDGQLRFDPGIVEAQYLINKIAIYPAVY
jgi:hypothetical protein